MENPFFRETIALLFERFGKHNINAKEYAEYLKRSENFVGEQIRKGELPGKYVSSRECIIPLSAIAKWELS